MPEARLKIDAVAGLRTYVQWKATRVTDDEQYMVPLFKDVEVQRDNQTLLEQVPPGSSLSSLNLRSGDQIVVERLERWPELHVYHFGIYEETALKKLMGRHATREAEPPAPGHRARTHRAASRAGGMSSGTCRLRVCQGYEGEARIAKPAQTDFCILTGA